MFTTKPFVRALEWKRMTLCFMKCGDRGWWSSSGVVKDSRLSFSPRQRILNKTRLLLCFLKVEIIFVFAGNHESNLI